MEPSLALLTDSNLVVPFDGPEVVSSDLDVFTLFAEVDLLVTDSVALVNVLSSDNSLSNLSALVKECFVTSKRLLFEDSLVEISSLIAAVVVTTSRFLFDVVASSDVVALGSSFFHTKILVVEVSTLSFV